MLPATKKELPRVPGAHVILDSETPATGVDLEMPGAPVSPKLSWNSDFPGPNDTVCDFDKETNIQNSVLAGVGPMFSQSWARDRYERHRF